MSRWRDCIVVLMDLIGVKKRAIEGNTHASALMRSFHDVVRREMDRGLQALSHGYVWNDSVLLLAYVDGRPQSYEAHEEEVLRTAAQRGSAGTLCHGPS